MSDHPNSDPLREQKQAARELLEATKRDLQLVDHYLEKLSAGRSPLELAADVSSEHRVAWVGVTDDLDEADGILVPANNTEPNGFGAGRRGTIRNQEDAAFVCTDILVALAEAQTEDHTLPGAFLEDVIGLVDFAGLIRLTDANTGRNLINGGTLGPPDKDRGAIPLSYLSSNRAGLGVNFKNKLFSEFTIPRASNVKVEIFNLGQPTAGGIFYRVYVSLLGFKVYGA